MKIFLKYIRANDIMPLNYMYNLYHNAIRFIDEHYRKYNVSMAIFQI